nr:hypothetical protein REQ54_02527 [Rhizobium sp. Q54]
MFNPRAIIFLNRQRLLAACKGQLSTLSFMDKIQLGGAVLGVLGFSWFASPEVELLTEIKNRLGPAIEQFDAVYVSKAVRKEGQLALNLKKVRTEQPLEYQLWMCGGAEGRSMIFFGEGFLGKEESENTLWVHHQETNSQVFLKVSSGGDDYVRIEEWDLTRSIKESDTRIVKGDVHCGEV